MDNHFLESEIFEGSFFRKRTGWYFNLHVDDWVFGFNLTHGPQSNGRCSFGSSYHCLQWVEVIQPKLFPWGPEIHRSIPLGIDLRIFGSLQVLDFRIRFMASGIVSNGIHLSKPSSSLLREGSRGFMFWKLNFRIWFEEQWGDKMTMWNANHWNTKIFGLVWDDDWNKHYANCLLWDEKALSVIDKKHSTILSFGKISRVALSVWKINSSDFICHILVHSGGDVLIPPFKHTDLRICVDGCQMIISFKLVTIWHEKVS
jgi:hypothetical protein